MTQLEKLYPNLILQPYFALQAAKESNSEAERHDSLLALGETLLVYVAGILLGEYKRSEIINKKIETQLYRFNNKNLSFGHYQSLVRLIHKELNNSIIHDKLHKNYVYEKAKEFVFTFDVLKKVVDESYDEGFPQSVEEEKRGKTAKKVGFLDFFDCFITVRNIKAHPEGKAGPKDAARKWPLTEAYYAYINKYLEPALMDIVEDFDLLGEYQCIRSTEYIEDEDLRARFVLESSLKENNVDLTLSKNQLSMLSKNQRFLLSPENKLYIRLFYNTIPQINKAVYKEVNEAEKAKQIIPHLKQMIRDKLSDNQRIDDLEYMVIYDTAKLVSMPEAKLFDLIDQTRKEMKIEASVGTPYQKGDLFVREKEADARPTFNPWWLKYFLLLPKIDNKKVDDEKKRQESLNQKIQLEKDKLKDLAAKKRVDAKNVKLREEKKEEQKAKIQQIINEREAEYEQTSWGIHKGLWKELIQYMDGLLSSSLNIVEKPEGDENEETEDLQNNWTGSSNQWQQGKLTHGYWGKIRPTKAPLDDLFHIGLWIGRNFKWLPGDIRSQELRTKIKEPCVILWTSENQIRVNKVDTDGKLLNKYRELTKDFIDGYAEKLSPLHLNVRCKPSEIAKQENNANSPENKKDTDVFMTLKQYWQTQENFSMPKLYSNLWTLDDFYDEGALNLSSIHQFESQIETLLGWFSNIITKLNDYAMELGIDADYIQLKEEQFSRYENVMHRKFAAATIQGKFKPKKEQMDEWKQYAKEELDINEYLFNLILSSYRSKTSKNG